MAEDLIAVAGDSVQAMTDLERRAGEVHQSVTKLTGSAIDHTKDLTLDEGKFNARFDGFGKHLVGLQTKLGQAGDRVAGRIGEQIKEVERQAKDLDAKHVGVRAHLKDLRAAVTKISDDVGTLQKDTHKALALISSDTAALLTSTVSALDRTEETVRTVTVPHVTVLAKDISSRAEQLHKHVETVLVPRIDQDVARLGGRMTTLSGNLALLLSKAQAQTLQHSKTQVDSFKRASATDWRGGSGEVDAAARAGELQRLGREKSAQVTAEAASLQSVASRFQEVVNTIQRQYSAVFAVPGQIDSIVRKVH